MATHTTKHSGRKCDAGGGRKTMHKLTRLGALIGVVIGAQVAAAQSNICPANVGGTPTVCDLTPTHDHIVVHHDRYGVPHATAQTFYGLNFQTGFEDARDRLVQLEFFRRASTGTLAEVFGRTQIQTDMDTRATLYSEDERQYFCFFSKASGRFWTI
jgi:penicillin amidase